MYYNKVSFIIYSNWFVKAHIKSILLIFIYLFFFSIWDGVSVFLRNLLK